MSAADTLVVGLGSIGSRHARVLGQLGRSVATVSRRRIGDHRDLAEALSATFPDYIVIANETSGHAGALAALARSGYRGRVLVEKPLVGEPAPLPAHAFAGLFVGYNLRFHPVVQRMAALVAGKPALAASVYAGQYLPGWRPGRDYRTTASASKDAGGGVLRDLSHELDYLLWLFGPWRRVVALTVKSGVLGIATEDVSAIMMECERCPAVSVQLNYHHRPAARTIIVDTPEHSFVADLVAGTITIDGETEAYTIERDETYAAMHAAVLAGRPGPCPANDGMAVVELIAAIEQAADTDSWIAR